MVSFEAFVFDADEVDRRLPEASWRGARQVRELNENGYLEEAVSLELQFMRERQPRLYNAATILAGYLRRQIDPALPEEEQILELGLMDEHVHFGFALGAIACRPQFVVPLRIERLYPDISQSSYELFSGNADAKTGYRPLKPRDDLELQMLVEAIDVNTRGRTKDLRETTDLWINYDRKTEQLEQAVTLAAVTAYTLIAHARNENYYQHTFDRDYTEYEKSKELVYPGYHESTDEAYSQYRAGRAALEAAPGSIRRMLNWRPFAPRPVNRPQKP